MTSSRFWGSFIANVTILDLFSFTAFLLHRLTTSIACRSYFNHEKADNFAYSC